MAFKMTLRHAMLTLMVALAPVSAWASMGMGSSDDEDPVTQARAQIDAGDYRAAIDTLEAVEGGHDADVYNLLGYSNRKLAHYDRAEQYYQRALAIEPQHQGANEYLGELYLETDHPRLARERLSVLQAACPSGCEAYDELAEAIHDYEGGATATGAM